MAFKSPPYTDGKGNQEKFKVDVENWVECHESLPDNKEITFRWKTTLENLCKGLLWIQLYGQGDECENNPESKTIDTRISWVDTEIEYSKQPSVNKTTTMSTRKQQRE